MTTDIAKRFPQNPLLSPADLQPSSEGLRIACLLNPGVFRFQGKTWLLVRVAERPEQNDIHVSFPILSPDGATTIMEVPLNDADLALLRRSAIKKYQLYNDIDSLSDAEDYRAMLNCLTNRK